MRGLSIFDILHKGVVYSLMGISGYSIFVGVYGHRQRKAALMDKVNERTAAAEQRTQEEIALARAAQSVVPSKPSS
ncbi:hypothetical protein FB451DRAFT_1549751 [Mycena latifolia]|nr:hypothetical protein FB451DRAFT_1549751 [Mycena latifolia]